MPPPRKFIFLDENVAQGLGSAVGALGVAGAAAFQIGINDVDDGSLIEKNVTLPWSSDPAISYLDYRNWIECFLDPGIVVHKPLPQYATPGQSQAAIDTLASVAIDDASLTTSTAGVNLVSKGGWTDFVQRMATSEYTFVLQGFGLRFGYPIPVPGLKSVAGVPAIPGKQWSLGNVILGNYSGVPLYGNRWRLEYTVAIPPKAQQPAPTNVAMHIGGQAVLPNGDVAMYSQADSNARASGPVTKK